MSTRDAFAQLRRVTYRSGQRGHFSSAQARDAGLTPVQLHRLVRRGVVVLAAPRVYRFAVSANPSWRERLAAELLSTGGMASGLSSVALYGLIAAPPDPDVLVPRGSRSALPGRHTTRELESLEGVKVEGLRALSPVRALIDSAHRVPRAQATTIVESAITRGLVKPFVLERRARELRHNKRPGCAVILSILAELHPELERSRNEWEALVVRRALQVGLPRPELEFEVVIEARRYILDAAWPPWLAALEFDGRDPHMRKRVHDRDSLRRNDLTAAGWLRFSTTAGALQRRDDRVFHQVIDSRAHAAGTAAIAHTQSVQYQEKGVSWKGGGRRRGGRLAGGEAGGRARRRSRG